MLADLKLAFRTLAKTPGFAAALVACFLPTRRATKVNPMVALRSE